MTETPPYWGSIFAVALLSGLTGYYFSQLFSVTRSANISREADWEDVQENDAKEPLLTETPSSREEHKLVLVVRTDLGMTKGKIAAQCGHATLACYKRASKVHQSAIKRWEQQGQAKIALKVTNEEEMLLLQATALSLNLVAEVIHDAGRTQIASGSATVLGIGPGPKSMIDQVTGRLSLL